MFPFQKQCDFFLTLSNIAGVRYNAEKKKVGNYYTTAIYRYARADWAERRSPHQLLNLTGTATRG